CYIFFFQAEDGIRCFHVTGVQTCALPIFAGKLRIVAAERAVRTARSAATMRSFPATSQSSRPRPASVTEPVPVTSHRASARQSEIGRASCRESVQIEV